MLELEADFQRAQAALERRPPSELAAFIMSLAHVPGIGCYVQAFAAADEPAAAAAILRTEIDILRQGQRTYPRRLRMALDWGHRLACSQSLHQRAPKLCLG